MLSDKTLRLNVDSALASPEFINYLLQAPFARRQIETSGTGSSGSMKNISQNEIRSLILPLPGIKEQRRLAKILDAADESIRSTERFITKLKRSNQGILHDILTCGIDGSGQLRDPKGHPDEFIETQVGLLPGAWPLASISQVVASAGSFIQTGPFGSQLHAHEYVRKGPPGCYATEH